MEPIFLRRSVRTASGLPEFKSQGGDIIVSEGGDAMSDRSRLSMPLSVLRVLKGLPRMLLSSQVILFSLLLANPMGMRGFVL
jgi:hypothetical protein